MLIPTTFPTSNGPAESKPLISEEGWVVQHLFFNIDHGYWAALLPEERQERRENFTRTIDSIRKHPGTQLLAFAMVSPKTELGFMLLTPDLHDSQRFEKQISLALGPDALTPAYSYLSTVTFSASTARSAWTRAS